MKKTTMKKNIETNKINFVEVSETRKRYLEVWRKEREIGKLIAGIPLPDIKISGFTPLEKAGIQTGGDEIKPGDIYLLPEGSTSEPSFSYVAILDREDGEVSAAPFSPHSVPAYKDEWLTGLAAYPLRVLQLWNVHAIPVSWLERGSYVGSFTTQQLCDAYELYCCALSGRWADFPLREATGLAIHDPQDDRLLYQEEQMDFYAPLRGIWWDSINGGTDHE